MKLSNLDAIDADRDGALLEIELQNKSFTHHYPSVKHEARILTDLTV